MKPVAAKRFMAPAISLLIRLLGEQAIPSPAHSLEGVLSRIKLAIDFLAQLRPDIARLTRLAQECNHALTDLAESEARLWDTSRLQPPQPNTSFGAFGDYPQPAQAKRVPARQISADNKTLMGALRRTPPAQLAHALQEWSRGHASKDLECLLLPEGTEKLRAICRSIQRGLREIRLLRASPPLAIAPANPAVTTERIDHRRMASQGAQRGRRTAAPRASAPWLRAMAGRPPTA